MKHLLITLLVALASTTWAADYPTLKLHADKSFTLDLNDWNGDNALLAIYDDAGNRIYDEKISGIKHTAKKYDLRKLPVGFYTINVKDESKEVTYDIFVSYDKVVRRGQDQVYFYPVIQQENEFVKLNILALNKRVNIKFKNQDGELLYEDKQDKGSTYGKQLDLSKLPAGDYILTMNVGEKVFTRSIVK